LWYPSRRWSFADFEIALSAAGGLRDTRSGRKSYLDYLTWLSADTVEQKRQGFEQMTRGWAKGSKDFKKAVLKDQSRRPLRPVVEAEATEIREAAWEARLEQSLQRLGKTEADLAGARKGAPWKIALARHLREQHLASHRWIAGRLHMGAPSSVQSLVSRHRQGATQGDTTLEKLKKS